MWEKLFNRDQFLAGVIFGILLPVAFYLALLLLDYLVIEIFSTHMLAQQSYLMLLSLAANLFSLRYYFVNLNFEKTGRGILAVTFVGALAYFAIY